MEFCQCVMKIAQSLTSISQFQNLMSPVFQKMQVDQEEPHVEEQQQQLPAENKTESEEMEV